MILTYKEIVRTQTLIPDRVLGQNSHIQESVRIQNFNPEQVSERKSQIQEKCQN